jgi:predicted CXXCH cytochrome family protein
MAEAFAKSAHAKVFVQMGAPGCATCHENHEIAEAGDEMLGLGEAAVCARCHSPDDPGGKTAATMREQIDTLRGEHEKAHAILQRAEQAGMEVSQGQFELNEAKNALVKARAAIHAFAAQAITGEIELGLQISAKAYERGARALEELQFRRRGLAVSVVFILALIGGLVVKIRQLDKRA